MGGATPSSLVLDKSRETEVGSLKIKHIDASARPGPNAKVYSLVVLGQSGHGKTTLLNALVNILCGVRYEDDVRYRLVAEEKSGAQHLSQTTAVTSYCVPLDPAAYGPDTWVEFIDTPGFGDQRGIEQDAENAEHIHTFLGTKTELHGICFVVNSTCPRLSDVQRYIAGRIKSIFAKDARDNIFVMATFADSKKPLVAQAFVATDAEYQVEVKTVAEPRARRELLPYKEMFTFNNSALYTPSEDATMFTPLYWQLCELGARRFFERLRLTRPFSLKLTQAVINERRQLQVRLDALDRDKSTELDLLAQIDAETRKIRNNAATIDASKEYQLTVMEKKFKLVTLPAGVHTTTCQKCNFTCHLNCVFENNADKARCSAMDPSTGHCTVCQGKCPWQVHYNQPHRVDWYYEPKTEIITEKKTAFDDAVAAKSLSEHVLARLTARRTAASAKLDGLLREVHAALSRLNEIALLPVDLNYGQYLTFLIEGEEAAKKDGYIDRIAAYRELKRKNDLLEEEAAKAGKK
jgi:GTP-binding protein EngB required for normal cell division